LFIRDWPIVAHDSDIMKLMGPKTINSPSPTWPGIVIFACLALLT
jgi:hypothetical protein